MRATLLDNITSAPTTGPATKREKETLNGVTIQATVTGTGALTATVIVEGSNDSINFLTLATITLSGTTTASDGYYGSAPWRFTRARLTALTGTGANVVCVMGS